MNEFCKLNDKTGDYWCPTTSISHVANDGVLIKGWLYLPKSILGNKKAMNILEEVIKHHTKTVAEHHGGMVINVFAEKTGLVSCDYDNITALGCECMADVTHYRTLNDNGDVEFLKTPIDDLAQKKEKK